MTTVNPSFSSLVLTAQKLLNNFGITDGRNRKLVEDGIWGGNTQAALEKFYAAYGGRSDEGAPGAVTSGVLNDLVRATNLFAQAGTPGTTTTTNPAVSSGHPLFQPIRTRTLPPDLVIQGQGGPLVVPLDTTGNVQSPPPPPVLIKPQSNTGLILGIAACLVGIVAVTLMQKK